MLDPFRDVFDVLENIDQDAANPAIGHDGFENRDPNGIIAGSAPFASLLAPPAMHGSPLSLKTGMPTSRT